MNMSKECSGTETEAAIDTLLDEIEEKISVAQGKGALTEDKHEEILSHVGEMRERNSKLKCLLSEIPSSAPEPESIVKELEEMIESPVKEVT